jgi:hypothetical protein
MTCRPLVLAILTVLILPAWAGCAKNTYTSEARYEQGLVVCLSGAGGGVTGECQRIRNALAAGGVDRAIEIFDWSGGKILGDQQAVAQNHLKAAELARHLEAYMASHPGRPVHLVAISAGTGLAVWALESLGGSYRAEGAILLASSLEARYDLAPALSRVNDRIYTFNSLIDPVLLTAVPFSGTVDQEGAVAGGLIGFRPPKGADDATQAIYRDKLVQHMWWPGDAVLGNLGDHLGTTNPLFVQACLAPIVKGRTPDRAVAAKAAAGKGDDWIVPPARPRAAAKTADKPEPTPVTNWSVGDAAASRKTAPEDSAKPPAGAAEVDESKFFSRRGDLP